MLRAEPLHPLLAGALLCASAAVGLADGMSATTRMVLVIGYLLLAPGYALLPFFGRELWLLHALLALSLSVALAIGMSTAMAVTGWWQVQLGVGATSLLVIVAVAWRTWRNRAAVIHLVGGFR